jgi:hypothetical protein
MKHILTTLISLVSCVVFPLASRAQSCPVTWQSGGFEKTESFTICLLFANSALTQQHYATSKLGFTVLGSNGPVVVQVTCIPNGGKTSVSVTAISSDAHLAEAARNTVRESIVNMHSSQSSAPPAIAPPPAPPASRSSS